MLGTLRLLRHKLDLDAPWVSQQEFDRVPDGELDAVGPSSCGEADWRTCLAWFAPLMKHGLDSRAKAFHLVRDSAAHCLRELILAPSGGGQAGDEWLELVPAPWALADAGLRAIQLMAFVPPWRREGKLWYRYAGEWSYATCVRVSPDELAIYVTRGRPALKRLPQAVAVD